MPNPIMLLSKNCDQSSDLLARYQGSKTKIDVYYQDTEDGQLFTELYGMKAPCIRAMNGKNIQGYQRCVSYLRPYVIR